MQTIEMEPIPEKEESAEAKEEEKPLDQPDGPIEVEKVVERFHYYQKNYQGVYGMDSSNHRLRCGRLPHSRGHLQFLRLRRKGYPRRGLLENV